MTTLQISLFEHEAVFVDAGARYTVPVGSRTLSAMIVSDPPLPEELTNAVGLFVDHLDDVTREVPGASSADVIELRGPGLQTLIDVEVGHPKGLPFELDREAAEEVFRTLATETARDRACNPGLPAAEVHSVLGVSCAVVAMIRGLRVAQVTVVDE
ncbi:MAG: hypothetical protein WCC60_11850 [Ilumatobacteraceae bacterium]